MNKKIPVSVWLTTLIIAMTVTFSLTMTFAMDRFDSTVASVQEKELMYSKISEIDKYVRANDYYEIDEETLLDMIASGYMFGINDKYAKYYTADAYTTLIDIESGKQIGIGVEIAKDATTGYAKVLKVYAGSPAEDLGIQEGYYITTIGDTDVKNISTTAALESALLGESGTTIAIAWLNGMMQAEDGTITRRNYTTTTVDYELLKDTHAYITIRDFDENTASEIDYAISTLQAQGAQSIIFDLRDNDSSNLDAVMDCINLICPSGVIAYAQYSNGTTEELGESFGSGESLPMICLVNGTTASAAELFALSARELAGAQLVGTQTAGVGTILSEPYRLSDGSAIVLTVAQIVTGAGTTFEGTGVSVDVEYVLSADEQAMYYNFTTETDPQLLKAITLANSNLGNETVGSTSEQSQSTDTDADADAEADADVETDADAEVDADTDAEVDVDSDAETDTEA